MVSTTEASMFLMNQRAAVPVLPGMRGGGIGGT